MAQAVLVGHQLDEPGFAIGVQILHLVRGEGHFVLPHLREGRVRKREALDVKLELIVLQAGHPVHQTAQVGQRGHLAAADVQHEAAHFQRRGIVDVAGREVSTRHQLAQRDQRIERAFGPGSADAHPVGIGPQVVFLGGEGRVQHKADAVRSGGQLPPQRGGQHRLQAGQFRRQGRSSGHRAQTGQFFIQAGARENRSFHPDSLLSACKVRLIRRPTSISYPAPASARR